MALDSKHARYPSGHAHTWLKLPKSNRGALTGSAIMTAIVAVLGAIVLGAYQGVRDGTLPLPPSLAPYAPWIVLVLSALTIAFVQTGMPSWHPDQSSTVDGGVPPAVR